MDNISKFLKKLNKKQRAIFLLIFSDIKILKIQEYDVKPLIGYKNIFRIRKNDIRIVFTKLNDQGIVLDIDFRKNIYKNQ